MQPQTLNFPFSAVSGQASFKLALILAAINPTIGGVLVSGPRGSAKSTLARGLADVLPYSNNNLNVSSPDKHQFVTLPLAASEEMLVGTIDLEKVLSDQSVAFQPGLLAKADGGVLYVDEVNLLPDNLVDLLLDVSASGVNRVERDGVSHSHTADFILLGTMNPDEGELRPQLLDRFGLSVSLTNQFTVEERVEIVRLRDAFDQDPSGFIARYEDAQATLSDRIDQARSLLVHVTCDDALRINIAQRCMEAQVDGMRADIVWYRAAVAHAAWHKRVQVTQDDVDAVAHLVLNHRSDQSDDSSSNTDGSSGDDHSSGKKTSSDQLSSASQGFQRPPESKREPSSQSSKNEPSNDQSSSNNDWGAMPSDDSAGIQESSQGRSSSEQRLKTAKHQWVLDPLINKVGSLNPQCSVAMSTANHLADYSRRDQKGQGAKGRFTSQRLSKNIDWFGSLVKNALSADVSFKDWVYRPTRETQPVLHLVLLDTSASVLQHQNFSSAKSLVSALANRAYLAREQMTLMGFGNEKVETLLPKKRAPKSLERLLNTIPASGGTPLRQMIRNAKAFQQQQLAKTPELAIQTYLITDGRTTEPFTDLDLLGQVTVIDTEASQVKRGKSMQIARALLADYFSLAQLTAPQGA